MALVVLGVIAGGAVLLAVAFKSLSHRKLLILVPVGAVVVFILLVGAVFAIKLSFLDVHRQATVATMELRQRDQQRAAIQQAEAAYQRSSQAEVLNYRGDADETDQVPVEDAVTNESPSPVEIFRYSPTGAAAEQPLSELPAWVSEKHDFEPASSQQTLVLSSEPWATVDEANEELYALLAVQAGDFLSAAYPETGDWHPTRKTLDGMPLIQDAVRESVPLQVGEHTVRVQHAHWNVELTPETRDQLFKQWREVAVNQRLVYLGAGLGGLTLLFAVAAGIFRLRRGPRVPVWKTATLATALLLWAGLAFVIMAQ
jgi:hypothetical protein